MTSVPIPPLIPVRQIRHFALILLLALLPEIRLSAQEAATGGQAGNATPTSSPSSRPSGLLTPPSDQAPVTTTTTTTQTTTTSSSAETDPREVARIQQQEIIRRQELIFRANQAIGDGQKAELATEYPEARKNYLFAVKALDSISRSTFAYAKAAEGLTRVDYQLYNAALKIGDTARAKMLIDEIVQYNPNNKMAQEKLAATDRALANPNDTSLLGNPAVTPAFVKQVTEAQRLFDEAEQFRRTGQWDEAEERLKRILGIDAYNIAATRQLERIEAEKNAYADKARLETRDERLRQIEEKWYEPITNKDLSSAAQEAQPNISRSTNFDVDQKLRGIFLSLDFSDASIAEATGFLSSESKRLDPEHKGVNFIIQPDAATTAKPITLTLNNVPLGEALRYVCQLANVKDKVQDYAISIVPFSETTDDLISRTFLVQPNFIAPSSAPSGTDNGAAGDNSGRRVVDNPATPAAPAGAADTARSALEAKGVKFPPGASAVYSAGTGQLTIVDTADQMELIEELVNAGQAPTLMVRIATKFVEINQTDLNDLTINSAFNILNPTSGDTSSFVRGTSFSTALGGSRNFSPDSIDQLISPQSLAFNSVYLTGTISSAQYNVVIDALSQKKSFDLLTEPEVIAKSGDQATLEAVRIFPYPVAFDPPELVTQTSNALTNAVTLTPPTVIATTPTDFKRRNVGVRLVIKPLIAADNKTIDLSLFPEVTDFEGFINYGSAISVSNPDGTTSLLSNNTINQPVFNTRRIDTKVLVRDGSTVVLGGLIREDRQDVNDKVPGLGDIPLIGRLFQSKATKSIKRNLIIFVTANIYRNDGELLNPPEVANAADILTGHLTAPPAAAQ